MADDNAAPPGFELLDLGSGFAAPFGPVYLNRHGNRLGFRVAPHHLNPVDTCHGGVLATFADMQIAAVRSARDINSKHLPTVSLSVDYLAPVALNSWVEAAVTLVKTTQTLVFTQALLTVNGEAVARAAAIYRNRQ
jgi:uncharacterized protein (TIGR00369 family)